MMIAFLWVINASSYFPRPFWSTLGRDSFIGIALAAYIGASTCLFGSLTAPRFHDLSNPKNTGYDGR